MGSSPIISSRNAAVSRELLASGEWRKAAVGEKLLYCGSNSVVESQPSKLLVAGSIPVSRSKD